MPLNLKREFQVGTVCLECISTVAIQLPVRTLAVLICLYTAIPSEDAERFSAQFNARVPLRLRTLAHPLLHSLRCATLPVFPVIERFAANLYRAIRSMLSRLFSAPPMCLIFLSRAGF